MTAMNGVASSTGGKSWLPSSRQGTPNAGWPKPNGWPAWHSLTPTE